MGWLGKHTALLAADTHIGYGMLIPFMTSALFNKPFIGLMAILVISIIKENTFDVWTEHNPFWTNGAIDFGFYGVGCIIAVGILALFGDWNFAL